MLTCNFFSSSEKVLHEVKHNFKAKFKESDLFRVYQSIDLGNLDPANKSLTQSIPSLMTLRHHLYSQECRHFMEDIAGIDRGTLTDEVDCAVNCHNQGCHLLCHDDVIGTRKVSYILYLTDPEPDWTDEDGGRLELYDCIEEKEHCTGGEGDESISKKPIKGKEPGVIPVKTILPKFNTMAYFVVQPGISFHSVQEVFCDRPRLSIQGWYHANEKPKQMEYASLNQLKQNQDGKYNGAGKSDGNSSPFTKFHMFEKGREIQGSKEKIDELNSEDIAFLSLFINEIYLKPESIKEIREQFEEDSSVQLRHFFNDKWEKEVRVKLMEEDIDQNVGRGQPSLDYSIGVNNDWKIVGPAHKQRYLQYVGDTKAEGDSCTCGSILSYLKKQLFQSSQFGRLLKHYSSLGMPLGLKGNVRRFRPGLDYTIAHYGILTKQPVLDATMCFVRGSGKQSLGRDDDNEDDLLWQSDDTGGFECYIAADVDEDNSEEADDEYDEEDDTKLLSVSASNNTLSLVYRDPGTMRFVKYVGSGAPSSRWDICLEYEVPDDDSDDSEKPHSEDVKQAAT